MNMSFGGFLYDKADEWGLGGAIDGASKIQGVAINCRPPFWQKKMKIV